MFYDENTIRSGSNCAQKKAKMINPVGSRVIYYQSLTVLQYRKNKTRSYRAITLLEITLAMAIMAIIFAAYAGTGDDGFAGVLELSEEILP